MKKIFLPALLAAVIALPFMIHDVPAQAAPDEPMVSMNFQDTDIRQVIHFMKDITGRVIVVDDSVKGTVTISAPEKMPVGEAVMVLNSALKAKGFTMVTAGNVIRIIPLEDSVQSNVETYIGAGPMSIPNEDMVITRVVPLKKVSAAQVRTDLKTLVGKNGEIIHNEGANSLIITDTGANINRLMKIIDYLDRESVVRNEIKVYTLDYAQATEIASLLSQLPKNTDIPVGDLPGAASTGAAPVETPVRLFGEMTVLADERSNSIVVASNPSNFAAIDKILGALDSMLSQVLIEVVIMEVSLTDDTKMGMEWYFEKAMSFNSDDYTGTADLGLDLASEEFGLKAAILKQSGAMNFLAFLLETEEKINILSTPMIMTSDNKKASIRVGREVPYLKETRRSTGDTRDYVYEYRDVGIGLEVTPHINEERFVVLDIHQEIKKLGPQTLFDAYIIITREADASVVVKDRNTVILGGLMKDDTTKSKSKVPVLGDLPLVGAAFRKTTTNSEKTELLVFITPYIVTNEDEVKEITERHKDIMKKLP